jgi:putative membrane protein
MDMTLQMLPMTWPFEPTVLLGVVVALGLYFWGLRYSLSAGLANHLPPWRWLCFVAGILSVFIALESPLDTWAGIFLWAHMIQHILLLYVAAPLLLLGAPLMPTWRAIPLETRRSTLRWLMLHPRPRRIGLALGRLMGNAQFIWFLFVVDFIVWHFAPVYDAALSHPLLHYFEHICFLVTGLLFWSHIIPSAPLKPRMAYPAQAAYLFLAAMATELVSMVLVYSGQPVYTYYLHVLRPAGSITPLIDQITAAAIMNVTDLVLYGTGVCVVLWLWIEKALKEDDGDAWPGTPGRSVQPRRAVH